MTDSVALSENLLKIKAEIPEGIELVAVSKFQPVDAIEAVYESGQRIFGESRVQELSEKISKLPGDIKWHFIGHLQTNKVKQLIGKTSLIESVDSWRLLKIIDEESGKAGVTTQVLLQLHLAEEETKFGFSPDEILEIANTGVLKQLRHTRIRGLMTMATNTDNTERVRKDFSKGASIFREIRNKMPAPEQFDILSMGMSGDWPIAVEEGANLIRIGTAIFGNRL